MTRLPRKIACALSYLLAPIYMARKAGRESGYMNAVHTAYDWNGSHQNQHYMTRGKIKTLFKKLGVNESDVIELKAKGLYRIKKHNDNEILKIDNKFSIKWQNNFLIASLNYGHLLRVKFNNNFTRVLFIEKIYIGERIRDLIYIPDKKMILFAMESSGSIGILEN